MISKANKPRPSDEAKRMKPRELRKSSSPFGGAVVTRVRVRFACGAIVVAIIANDHAVVHTVHRASVSECYYRTRLLPSSYE